MQRTDAFMTKYYDKVYETTERFPELRAGQVAFTVLTKLRFDWAHEIWGSPLDPFYDDERLPAFYTWLAQRVDAL